MTSNLSVTVPEGDPEAYDFGSNKFGIVNVPVATYNVNRDTGFITYNAAFPANYALYEPSTSDLYLYKQLSAYDTLQAKRGEFEKDVLMQSNNTLPNAPANAYSFYGLGQSKFEIEQPVYSGDFKIKRHIIISPNGANETLYGFAISNKPPTGGTPWIMPTNLERGGLHCVFDAPWTRPKDSFLKIYFEHNWSRLAS